MKFLLYAIAVAIGFVFGAIAMLSMPVVAAEKSSGEKLCYALVAAKLLRTCSW